MRCNQRRSVDLQSGAIHTKEVRSSDRVRTRFHETGPGTRQNRELQLCLPALPNASNRVLIEYGEPSCNRITSVRAYHVQAGSRDAPCHTRVSTAVAISLFRGPFPA